MTLRKHTSIVYFAPSTRSHPMADVLASLGAEVHSCHDDLEALALVLRGEAEAVCVEQTGQLPARFYRILRRRSEQQPLVILAVLPDDDPVQKSLALQAGADAALVATMAPEEVEAILESQFRVQRQRLELLREHNALSRALDCVDEGILIMNREGRVLQANRKCLSMLDLDPDVLRERSVPQLLNVLGVPRETIDRVMESEEAFLENIEVHTADGPKSVVVDCRRILDLTGSSERRWLVQFRDSSLVHTLDRLQEDFHTWAAHELRSHLSVLTAEVDALEYGDHPFDRAAMSGALRREVENLAASIEEGLESLRSGEEPTQASLDPISLLGCLEGALADVEGLALARGQRLRLDLDPECGQLEFRAQIRPLQQALRYVLVEAIAASPDDAEVLLTPSIEAQDLHLRLTASDEDPRPEPRQPSEEFLCAQSILRGEGGDLRHGVGRTLDLSLRLPVIAIRGLAGAH